MKPQQKTMVGLFSYHCVELEGVERLVVADKKYDTTLARQNRAIKRQSQGGRNKRQWLASYSPRTTDDLFEDIQAASLWYENLFEPSFEQDEYSPEYAAGIEATLDEMERESAVEVANVVWLRLEARLRRGWNTMVTSLGRLAYTL